jgi:four helix bundle protein
MMNGGNGMNEGGAEGAMNPGDRFDLKIRTKAYALGVIRFYSSLPQTVLAQTLGKQVLRSGTSVGAQYREASRARSRAEFVSKIESSLQELDETDYWLELLEEVGVGDAALLEDTKQETRQLTAIFTSSAKTAKRNSR